MQVVKLFAVIMLELERFFLQYRSPVKRFFIFKGIYRKTIIPIN